MSDLLTHAEYQALAAALDPPRSAFIDGRYRPGTGAPLTTTNPATGAVITEIAACGAADVDLAVSRAREAFEQGVWAKRHPTERKDVLIRLCKLITRNRRELAVMESLDSGKPIRDCETIDIPETIHCLKWHAEAIDKIYDQTGPAGDDALSIIVREPVGVVAAILPPAAVRNPPSTSSSIAPPSSGDPARRLNRARSTPSDSLSPIISISAAASAPATASH